MGDYDDDYFDGNKNAGKQVIATKITGKVKWYNVKKGFGFIHRDDIDEDVFVHQTAILRVQPGKNKSLGDDEDVLFDVVKGLKGSEAINVTGPSGEAVRGSIYASSEGSGYHRDRNVNDNNSPYEDNSYSRGRGGYRGRGRGLYNSYQNHDDDDNQFGGESRPRGRGGRGYYSSYQNNDSRDYNYVGDEGKERGRGGYSRGSRGGSDMSDSGFPGRRPSRRNFRRGF